MFGTEANKYWDKGLSVLPIKPATKRPIFASWQHYCTSLPDETTKKEWMDKYDGYNIGLALGTDIGGYQLVAIDVDDDEIVDKVIHAVGNGPMKKGAKGITILALADKKLANTKIKRKLDGSKSYKPAVEFLANGSQTVLPPSIHPDGPVYAWVGPDLLSSLASMPIVTTSTLDEIRAFCQEKASPIQELNTMVWKGVNGGGNTHDVCVAAVACMVSRGWTDPEIHARINRAKKNAVEGAGEVYSWPHATKIIQEWIDSARDKGMTDSGAEKKKKLPPERVMADWAADYLGGYERIVCYRGQLRRYRDGHWPEVNLAQLAKDMYQQDPYLTLRDSKSAIHILHTLTQQDVWGETEGLHPKDDPKKQRVCLLNGTLNLKTGELERHSPDHQLCNQLNFEWDEDAVCPTYDQVLFETFRHNNERRIKHESLWDEFCGLSLVDDMSFQKMLFLKGPGGNGKGTLTHILRNMHDPNAVGSVSITDLNDERKRTSLVGKMINISAEQSHMNLVSDTYLKKITGEDPVDVRKLYGETQNNVSLSVRFLELVNRMPSTSDSSDALRRRIMLLTCPNKVTNPDINLKQKLMAERAGILKRWMQALHNLYERGAFDVPEESDEEVDDYITQNDPVRYWFRDNCDPCEENPTSSRELFAHFSEWSDAMKFRNHKQLNDVQWGQQMTEMGYPATVQRVGRQVVRVRAVKLRNGREY